MAGAFYFAQSDISLATISPHPCLVMRGEPLLYRACPRNGAPLWIAPMTPQLRRKSRYCRMQWLCLLVPTLVLLFVAAPLFGQKTPTISVDVNVVNVFATVRDKHGHIVNNLTKDDFTLQADGHPQTIRYFSRETELPLTLGLLVDTSLSQRSVIDKERSASYTFLDQMLREDKDKAFLIHFDHQVELLEDLTSSRSKLQAGLQSLSVQQPQLSRRQDGGPGGNGPDDPQDPQQYPRRGGDDRGRGGMGMRGMGTRLYDAVYLASNELMAKQHGRKALIVLSDGVDIGSKVSLVSALESAQRANTVVYSILFKGDEGGGFRGMDRGGMGRGGRRGGMGWPGGGGGGWPGGGGGGRRMPERNRPDGKKILAQISKETGGRLFEVSKKHPIEEIYKTIQEELRNQYSLGFTPDSVDNAAGYHKITLTAKKGLIVQTRDSYYGKQ